MLVLLLWGKILVLQVCKDLTGYYFVWIALVSWIAILLVLIRSCPFCRRSPLLTGSLEKGEVWLVQPDFDPRLHDLHTI